MQISTVWFLHGEIEVLLLESAKVIVTFSFYCFGKDSELEELLNFMEGLHRVMRSSGGISLTLGGVKPDDICLEVAMCCRSAIVFPIMHRNLAFLLASDIRGAFTIQVWRCAYWVQKHRGCICTVLDMT